MHCNQCSSRTVAVHLETVTTWATMVAGSCSMVQSWRDSTIGDNSSRDCRLVDTNQSLPIIGTSQQGSDSIPTSNRLAGLNHSTLLSITINDTLPSLLCSIQSHRTIQLHIGINQRGNRCEFVLQQDRNIKELEHNSRVSNVTWVCRE